MRRRPEGLLTVAELADAYHRYDTTNSDDDFWAWERVTEIVRGPDAQTAWNVVIALTRTAADERLEYIGAGPVEDLVCTHGTALVDYIEVEARRDPRFREALASIWLIADEISSDVLSRLQGATGGRIRVATQAAIDAANEPWPRSSRA